MTELPTGTITFLFTDIEGSTQRWERFPGAMGAAIARHDAVLREAIEAQGGYVFKTVGDAFCAAFATAQGAITGTLAAQRAVHAEQWGEVGPILVRMALHTGAAEERDGDYFGPPLNRVARLLSAGHGGQVLLSQPTYDLVRDHLPEEADLLDLGEHRLKDLIRPEHVFQLVVPDLPSTFLPLKTLGSYPNNLPAQPTSLIGREGELAAAQQLLRDPGMRLLTLTGPGGTGKTRLGLQLAADMLEEFQDGAFFVELAPVSEVQLVASSIAQTLGVRESPGQGLVESLKDYLRHKQMLLMLDNFEQVVAASPLVSELMAGAPRIKFLVTSREALHLRGEHEFAVPPLAVPDPEHLPSLDRLTQYEAVRLFIERAVAVKPEFEVTNENAPSVAEICHRLDGLPLAIELAAARVKLFAPQAMLGRLESRLKLLTGGARDLPARQQTLRGAIAWSYDLLTQGEQMFFRRISVFVGGCTLEAAEIVCNAGGDTAASSMQALEIDIVDGVSSLVDKSLLRQQDQEDGEPRFTMLETIREYGLEQLAESGEDEEIRGHHRDYFLQFAEHANLELRGARQKAWLESLEIEHSNLRAALRWAAESGQAEMGLRLAGSLWRFWYVHGHLSEGRAALEAALALASPKSEVKSPESPATESSAKTLDSFRARALHGLGRLLTLQGDYETAKSLYEQSLAISRELGDKAGAASALNDLGSVARSRSDYASARSLHEESLAIYQELGPEGVQGIAESRFHLGNAATAVGDYASARSLLEESLTSLRRLEDKRSISLTLMCLGNVALAQSDYASALRCYEENLALSRELGDKWSVANSLVNVGNASRYQGDYARAQAYYEEGLAIFREVGAKRGIGDSLYCLGHVALAQSDYPAARTLFQESLAIRQGSGNKRHMAECLEGLAGVACQEHSDLAGSEHSAALFGAASALREASRSPIPPADRAQYDLNLTSAQTSLGKEAFDTAWEQGRAMTAEQAVAHALGGPASV